MLVLPDDSSPSVIRAPSSPHAPVPPAPRQHTARLPGCKERVQTVPKAPHQRGTHTGRHPRHLHHKGHLARC